MRYIRSGTLTVIDSTIHLCVYIGYKKKRLKFHVTHLMSCCKVEVGRVIAQADSRHIQTKKDWVLSEGRPRGTCDEQSGTGTVFYPTT
jgi:ribosomal protein S17